MDIWLTTQQLHTRYFFLRSSAGFRCLPFMDSKVTHQRADAAPHHLQVSLGIMAFTDPFSFSEDQFILPTFHLFYSGKEGSFLLKYLLHLILFL